MLIGWAKKLKDGLKTTSAKLASGITNIVTKKKLDSATLLELEELMILSDMGIETSKSIIHSLTKIRFDKEVSTDLIKEDLAKIISDILISKTKKLDLNQGMKPHVILMCGVNGNGKTTTTGKLAAQNVSLGKKVLLGSCDTFRAAAHEQLSVWAERTGAKLIGSEAEADPASVAFKALEQAKIDKADLVILDTAGRLSNKKPLMDELAKINRVIKKIDESAPHDTILVLDATSGQNAIQQVKDFKEIVNITGIIVTKLDGSAKAGIVVAIAQQFDIPIVAVGVGEKIEDLNAFDPQQFARDLLF